jgi:PKD repeat protein
MAHSYSAPGSYQVTLTVIDDGGLDDTATHKIAIEEPVLKRPPMAVINGPTKGLVGEPCTFDGSSSSDTDGAILSYTWDFGDGPSDSGISVSHSYNAAGTYNVTLTVTDDDDLSDTSSYTLLIEEQVVNQPPVAVISGPTNGLVGEPLTFNGSGSSDSDGAIVDYTWAFQDGSSASGVSGEHTFQAAGDRQVTLTVTDDGGLTHSASLTVHIDQPPPPNQPPTAVISGPTSGLLGETLRFDGSGSSDRDGRIIGYDWDLGDGAVHSGKNVTHKYAAAGSYTLSLTVTDDGGLNASTSHTVQIE